MLDVCGIIGTKRWHKIGTVRGTERPLRGASDYRLDRNRVGIAFPVELRVSGLIFYSDGFLVSRAVEDFSVRLWDICG